jgi:hypothetical protein
MLQDDEDRWSVGTVTTRLSDDVETPTEEQWRFLTEPLLLWLVVFSGLLLFGLSRCAGGS